MEICVEAVGVPDMVLAFPLREAAFAYDDGPALESKVRIGGTSGSWGFWENNLAVGLGVPYGVTVLLAVLLSVASPVSLISLLYFERSFVGAIFILVTCGKSGKLV